METTILNFKTLFVFSLSLIFILLVFYLFQITSFVYQSSLVQTYESQLADLDKEHKELGVELAEVNSLSSIESFVYSFNFEKIDKIRHFQVLGTQVAAK